MLLCARHHTLLHHPGIPWGDPAELDPERLIDANTLPPDDVVGRVDIGYAVMVMVMVMVQQSA